MEGRAYHLSRMTGVTQVPCATFSLGEGLLFLLLLVAKR